MLKSVLISVQPKWSEKITHIIGQKGTKPIYEKSVEIRKTKPKIYTPFKCYIYCTKPKGKHDYGLCIDRGISGKLKSVGLLAKCNYEFAERNEMPILSGKVIGEFVCDYIQEYESEFVDDDCFEMIASIERDDDGDATGFIEWTNDGVISYINTDFFKKCCVKYEELKKYIGLGINTFYGWHISDFVIYDKPKELSEFFVLDGKAIKECEHRERVYQNPDYVNGAWLLGGYVCNKGETDWCCDCKRKPLTRPPQSWCYVEGGMQV